MRYLEATDVECRIGQVSKQGKGLSLLLYKDARCDMRMLDEEYGPLHWACNYEEIGGKLFCSVGVYDEKTMEWVWKSDVGAPSNIEAEKGEASDAFKRACFKWGIGRELYTAPFIWVKAEDCNLQNGKCYDTFAVNSMEVKDGRITQLSIVNEKTKKTVFSWDVQGRSKTPKQENKASDHLQPIRDLMKSYCAAKGIDVAQGTRDVMEWAGVEKMSEISPDFIPDVVQMMQDTIAV